MEIKFRASYFIHLFENKVVFFPVIIIMFLKQEVGIRKSMNFVTLACLRNLVSLGSVNAL